MPAVVKVNTYGIHVEYWVLNPQTDKMERFRVRCNKTAKRYKKKSEKLLAVQRIADDINKDLSCGWSPLHETEDARLYTPLPDLREKFLKSKASEGIRETTLTSYSCITGIFLRHCEDRGRSNLFSGTFLRQDAVRYLDDLKEDNSSNRNYNNHLKVLRTFFNWAKEHCYCRENAFENCKSLKNEKKKRILIDAPTRRRIAEWCEAKCEPFGLVVRLIYSSAIRPKEIANIQLKHIDLRRHIIIVPEENAKNGKQRCATLSPELVRMLTEKNFSSMNQEWYLFGQGQGMVPGEKRVSLSRFRKRWDKLRKDLELPREMQMYSLRDTGLTDLLHSGVDQLTVQHHADHSSLAVQAIYTDHFDSGLAETIYNSNTQF